MTRRKKPKETVIPAGLSSKERTQHDEISVEARHLNGSTLIAGEVVSTPIRKLLECGAISDEEAHAAYTFRYDHDTAFASCKSSLAGVAIDGGSGGDNIKHIHHAERFRKVKEWLKPSMCRIAEASILGTVNDIPYKFSFTSLGQELVPTGSPQEHIAAGKGALSLVIRELYGFYSGFTEEIKPRQRSRMGKA